MRPAPNELQGGARTVWGTVAAAGTVLNPGSADWTVTKTGTGTYTLRWNRLFRGVPAMAVAALGFSTVSAPAPAADSSTIQTATPNTGAFTDAAFSFEAVGR